MGVARGVSEQLAELKADLEGGKEAVRLLKLLMEPREVSLSRLLCALLMARGEVNAHPYTLTTSRDMGRERPPTLMSSR